MIRGARLLGRALRSILSDARSCESWSRSTGEANCGRTRARCKGRCARAISRARSCRARSGRAIYAARSTPRDLRRAIYAALVAAPLAIDGSGEVRHVQHAEARARLEAGNAGVEPVVTRGDVDQGRARTRRV